MVGHGISVVQPSSLMGRTAGGRDGRTGVTRSRDSLACWVCLYLLVLIEEAGHMIKLALVLLQDVKCLTLHQLLSSLILLN